MVTQLAPKVYTPKEYLALELEADNRHEFINGEIRQMAGGTTKHNVITGNIYVNLRLAVKGKNIPVYIENVRLWIPIVNVFTYPDVMILAGEPIYYEESQTTITNPVVIFEVLSNSTRDYDQGQKFRFYRSLETLQEYVLVDQERCSVMVYQRANAKEWNLHILEEFSEVIRLKSVAVEVALQDIYDGVFNQ